MYRDQRFEEQSLNSSRRKAITLQLDEHTNRIKELLRNDINQLEEENKILRSKLDKVKERQALFQRDMRKLQQQNKYLRKYQEQNRFLRKLQEQNKYLRKVQEQNKYLRKIEEQNKYLRLSLEGIKDLQQKIQLLLTDNSQLLSDNTRLTGLLKANNHQAQLRGKDFQINRIKEQKQIIKAQLKGKDFQISHLKQQRQKIKAQLKGKDFQISHLKQQRQKIKAQLKVKDFQISRMKEQKQVMKTKDFQISHLKQQRQKMKAELRVKDLQVNRLKQQKQKMKGEFKLLEGDIRKQLDNHEKKHLQQIQARQKIYNKQIQALQKEKIVLRQDLDGHVRQIDQLQAKLARQRYANQQELNDLKKENSSIKQQIVNFQIFAKEQSQNIKSKLTNFYEGQIQNLKRTHIRLVQAIKEQCDNLQSSYKTRIEEIQTLKQQKSYLKQKLQHQSKYKYQLEKALEKINLVQINVKKNNQHYEQKLKEKNNQVQYLDDLTIQTQKKYQKEIKDLKQIIADKKDLIQKQNEQFQQKQTEYKKQIQNQKQQAQKQIESIKAQYEDQIANSITGKQTQIQQLMKKYTQKIQFLEAELQNKQKLLVRMDKENQMFKDKIFKLQKENQKLRQSIKIENDAQHRLNRQIDSLRGKLIDRQKSMQSNLYSQKNHMDSVFMEKIQNIKIDYDALLRIEKAKVKDLTTLLKTKEKELQQLFRMYKSLKEEMYALTQQEGNKRNIDLKIPGASSQLIATKNLFDVFLKTKISKHLNQLVKQNVQ